MKRFKSDNFVFRPTALGLALMQAGAVENPQMIREAKKEALVRERGDDCNALPSVKIELSA